MDKARGFFFGGLHYRREPVWCGKGACKRCPHGPYWYAYDQSGIYLRKRYVGRQLPVDVRAYAPAWAQ